MGYYGIPIKRIVIPHAQHARDGGGVVSLSLLPRGGFARPLRVHVDSAAVALEKVSVPCHCIDAEIKRLTGREPATPCTLHMYLRVHLVACFNVRGPVEGISAPSSGADRLVWTGRLGRNSSRQVGCRVVVAPTMRVSLAVTNKLECASEGP